MKKSLLLFALISTICVSSYSQDNAEVKRVALDYIEGFYQGDTLKINRSIHKNLSKFGYGINQKSKKYVVHPMTYEGAINFALGVQQNPKYAAPNDAVKKIEILDIQDKIACVKLTVYWGIDYLLLAKENDKWMIVKVLWQEVPE